MHRELTLSRRPALLFAREHLRSALTLALLITLPPIFVIAASAVLSPFATALGGNVAGQQASALGAGWAVAFLAGALGYFQTASSRDADRRLARAGLGAFRTATGRLLSSLVICVLLTLVAATALWLKQPIPHLAHTLLAMLAYAAIYLGIGTAVGAVVTDELAGSLAVVFVFILDVFAGPGMAPPAHGLGQLLTPSRYAGELLLEAGAGTSSSAADWRQAAISVLIALAAALTVFWLSARRRT